MLIIRPAKRSDAPFIWGVFTKAAKATSESYYTREIIDAWSAEVSLESFDRGITNPASITLVAEIDDKVSGFGKLSIDRCEIDALYVDPDCQGAGVGKALINAILEICQKMSMREVRLNASLPAVRFYEQAGFKVIEESIYTLSNGLEMSIKRMEKILSADG